MDTKEAKRIIERTGKYKVHKISKNKFLVKGAWQSIKNSRELIKFARIYSSESLQNTKIKSGIKEEQNYKARSSVKQSLVHERYDDIPSKGYPKQCNVRNHF